MGRLEVQRRGWNWTEVITGDKYLRPEIYIDFFKSQFSIKWILDHMRPRFYKNFHLIIEIICVMDAVFPWCGNLSFHCSGGYGLWYVHSSCFALVYCSNFLQCVLSTSTATLPAAPKPSDSKAALGVMCAETRAVNSLAYSKAISKASSSTVVMLKILSTSRCISSRRLG